MVAADTETVDALEYMAPEILPAEVRVTNVRAKVVDEAGCAVKIADNNDAMLDVETLGIGFMPG